MTMNKTNNRSKNNKPGRVRRAAHTVARAVTYVGRRAKSVAKRAARRAAQAAKAVARKTKQVGQAVARKLEPATKRIAPLARRAWAAVATTWRTVIKPFLKSWGIVFAGTMWGLALVLAPAPTLIATSAAGLGFLGLAKGVEKLQASSSKLARIALGIIDFGAQLLRTLFYTTTAAMVLLTAAISLPMLLVYVTDLALMHFTGWRHQRQAFAVDVAEAVALGAAGTPRVRSRHEREADNLEIPTVIRRQRAAVVAVPAPTPAPVKPENLEIPTAKRRQRIEVVPAASAEKPKALRARGAEEMHDMPACDACGSIEGGFRYRSNDIQWTRNLVTGEDSAPQESSNRLCSECYDAECEMTAIEMTGVSLKKRNVEFRLNARGLTSLPQYAQSLERTDTLFWTLGATAWYRDHKGNVYDRSWACFHKGKVVAVVNYAHRNKTYVAVVGDHILGAERSLGAAKALANDTLMDERNAVATFVEALGGIAEAGETFESQGG